MKDSEELLSKTKSYDISKRVVWDSYRKVKGNKGAAGIDDCTIEKFEEDLENNLYKLWNRMSSGSYFPAAVQHVEIPKSDGGIRVLGIPTVTDRIAQMVVKQHLEPELEQLFHRDSYGYRPNRSAKHAIAITRRRCWKHDWVIDLDIKGFFDNIPHDLMLQAVKKHSSEKWMELYVERWLTAPIQQKGEEPQVRVQGTPQGGVISPLLANLFLHYAFDHWMQENNSGNPFARYADDIVIHCNSKSEAKALMRAIADRLQSCGLALHPEKSKIVYCRDKKRKGGYPTYMFDFLGYTFRPRVARNKSGVYFVGFQPAISSKAKKLIFSKIRSWGFKRRSDLSLKVLASKINPAVRGWLNYYGAFYKSALLFMNFHLDQMICRWAMRKYKKQGANTKKVTKWLDRCKRDYPWLFAHWELSCA